MTVHSSGDQCMKEARRSAGSIKVRAMGMRTGHRVEGRTRQLKPSQYTADSSGRAQPTSFLHSGGCLQGCWTW